MPRSHLFPNIKIMQIHFLLMHLLQIIGSTCGNPPNHIPKPRLSKRTRKTQPDPSKPPSIPSNPCSSLVEATSSHTVFWCSSTPPRVLTKPTHQTQQHSQTPKPTHLPTPTPTRVAWWPGHPVEPPDQLRGAHRPGRIGDGSVARRGSLRGLRVVTVAVRSKWRGCSGGVDVFLAAGQTFGQTDGWVELKGGGMAGWSC